MMLVGLRPTVGRISRYGIIPLTADHDTAGPMARSVTDAAILLGHWKMRRRTRRMMRPGSARRLQIATTLGSFRRTH